MKVFAEGSRIVLREIVASDADDIFHLDSDIDVVRYVGNAPLVDYTQAVNIVENIRKQYDKYGIARWAVIDKSTNSFIGWAGLKYIDETVNGHTNYYDLGYRLAKQYWGKGYATEAAKAALDYGFMTMALTDIYAIADSENVNSHHVLEKSGLVYINEFEHEAQPHRWYHISKNEYKKYCDNLPNS
jgi:[ribosomal protein S5]-alanine N-acetyltransferase